MIEEDYRFIKFKVRALLNIDLDSYKSVQMQRRLDTYLLRSGQPNWPTFFRVIQEDPELLGKFRDYLTINVSSFFRDPEKFAFLRKNILPELMRTRARLRVWSAGCSQGHEPYSLAILLAELTGAYAEHYLLATDIDQSVLAFAQKGGPYTADKLTHVDPAQLQRYFRPERGGQFVIDLIRRRVTFRYHNLLNDPFESDFDLIVCRNVVIYFEAETKNQLYRRFYEALRPGGIFFIGSTEVLPYNLNVNFDPVGISFYRRRP